MIKERIKGIPFLGPLVHEIYIRILGRSKFTTSGAYWEERYKKGGNSGAGSYNNLAQFKGEIINQFVYKNKIETIIEFGSGDGNQLGYFNFKSYLGFDVSQTAISNCQNMYKSDPSKRFELVESYRGEKADLTLSLDVIYHLIEDDIYDAYMERLFSSSNKFVIVYSSNSNEGEYKKSAPHIKHRHFTDWVEKNSAQFKLVKYIPNKFPENGDNHKSSFADFFIFQIQMNKPTC